MTCSSQKLAHLAAVNRSLTSLVNFLRPAYDLINFHVNDFFTTDGYEIYLHEKLKQDLEKVSITQMRNYMRIITSQNREGNNGSSLEHVNFKESSLEDLVCRIAQLQLHNMNVAVQVEDVLSALGNVSKCTIDRRVPKPFSSGQSGWEMDPLMSPKKLHEVEVMSDFINEIQRAINTTDNAPQKGDYLIDVGSGKGYLSTHLTLLQNFRVLAIDSNSVNTKGCTKRSALFRTRLSNVLQRGQDGERQVQDDDSRRRKRKYWRSKSRRLETQSPSSNHKETSCQVQEGNVTQSTNENELLGDADRSHESIGSSSIRDDEGNNNVSYEQEEFQNLKNMTLFVTQDLNLAQLLRDNFDNDDFIDQEPYFGLIGLHTCGPLGTDSMKLFMNCPQARFIVNVPCCHHLVEEFYCPDWAIHSNIGSRPSLFNEIADQSFPLSRTLNEQRFYLGRNARMICSLSLQRMCLEQDLQPERSLFFRSMLQLLIKQKLGHTLIHRHARGLANKNIDFIPYVRKALVKLELDNEIQVTDEEIEQHRITCEEQSEKYHKMCLFRSLFAPLVEGCLLLDRLAYLLERETRDAYLVELFDPKTSPRCYALVAFK